VSEPLLFAVVVVTSICSGQVLGRGANKIAYHAVVADIHVCVKVLEM
jgi:hypothetical protein